MTQQFAATVELIRAFLALSTSLNGQTTFAYIDDDWPNSRYIVHGDGTVTDTATSLMWRQCNSDRGYNAASNTCSSGSVYNRWHGAIETATSYSDGTYSDWRLPNIKELESIITYNRGDPTVNTDIFIDFIGIGTYRYWSSTPRSSTSTDAYSMIVDFDTGKVGSGLRESGTLTYIMVRDAQ